MRLVGGSSSREGRLEVLYNDVWRSVCYDYGREKAVNDAAARVVCSILGFGYVCSTLLFLPLMSFLMLFLFPVYRLTDT